MTEETTNDDVLIEQAEGIILITLNRPRARNAINRAMSDAIAETMQRADTDPAVRAMVITSSTSTSFCAGADLKETAQGVDLYASTGPLASWGLAGSTARTPSVPVIAAVEGQALGGGFEIVLAADIVVASSEASFGLPEVRVGLMPGAGGAVRLPRQLPRKVAMDMMLTRETLSAGRAYSLGLVSRLTDPGSAHREAYSVAEAIANGAPLAVRATKEVALELNEGVESDETTRWQRNEKVFGRIMASNDAREGTEAFSEKREPVWAGL
ncbi:enoyl-CoA hydratase-related protein [Ancrocorticia sp.]|uniref:enoyl-CoA hydratase-related protein n=1 Tax=Ancrocorticia sp. TaxID=2593684 RepID=UPI003F8F2998